VSSTRLPEVLGWIGANVRQKRREKGLTQAQLAELADQDLSYLQRVERGVVNVSVKVVVSLADALHVPPESLFARSAPPPAKRGRPSGAKP
jgi:transcriptional regulator with XRE-family HTH domain